ncbi:hypothetical protein B0A50_03786 [Salinomyces thailandicus]|uniref:Fe2OG dioxygenase domain-containing protein n=1 Tax=Salinomyces thailandicus TaxID=706561 RepID=A0A4U0U4B0_9PEZI|nr:hypothetical protein B0A50_03786 [Salinomyces thailandica]
MTPAAPAFKIPLIDIRPSNPHAAHQLLTAATETGFIYLPSSCIPIPPSTLNTIFALSQSFFKSPLSIKQPTSISSNAAGKNLGWVAQGIENLDPSTQKHADVKEAFNLGEPDLAGNNFEQPLPTPLQAYEQLLVDFYAQCHELCQILLRLFAVALGVGEEWFTSRHDRTKGPSGTVLRLLYYPSRHVSAVEGKEGGDMRAGAHSDYGSLTLLFQQRGQPGLEVKGPGGDWVGVPVDPEGAGERGEGLPVLVNIGDLLEDWTAGLLKSTVHRVVFPPAEGEGGADRYSIAYFCHPVDEARLEAVPSDVVKAYAAARKGERKREVVRGDGSVMTARDHLMERLAATYTVK